MRVLVRAGLILLALLIIAGVAGGFWARRQLTASLPQLDGTLTVAGLSAPVTIARDDLGIPTVVGKSREDVARALGVLHAQERFFEMDLSRRRAAGELAALVGSRALPPDREIRVHRFRAVARRALAALEPRERAVLDAYTAGVNSGLSSLGTPPFEYVLLRQDPKPWLPEDSLLVVLSMFITLQDYTGSYESTLATMHDVLPAEMVAFLAPDGTEWDSPLVGPAFSVPPIPGPEVYDLRTKRSKLPEHIEMRPPRKEETRSTPNFQLPTPNELPTTNAQWSSLIAAFMGVDGSSPELMLGNESRSNDAIGSNNWAVAGRLTEDGGALVANDMHLTVRVPNTWYRAWLEWPDPSNGSSPIRLIGITLPGVPALVVGSNTHIAWGFTNTYADWSDLVLLELDPQDRNRYQTPGGWRNFERHDEVIEVAGRAPEHVSVMSTIWGPVIEPDHRGRPRALRWVAHDAERLGVASAALETARTVDEAFDAVNGLGTPGQNFVVADEQGHIGWTVYGSIPRRAGFDGRIPQSWADGSRGWNGWLAASEYPRLRDPQSGRIWTANARVVDGEMLARLGDGNYEVGSRARIIRDRLMARERFAPRDLLDIQLETNAAFLSRWRDLLLKTLTPSVVASDGKRAQLRDLVERTWDGRASAASAGYRLTRMFREEVTDEVIAFVLRECFDADPGFDYRTIRRREGPIWKMVSERPQHLLAPQFADWDKLLLVAVNQVVQRATEEGGLAAPWSRSNVTAYRHPLSSAIPIIGGRLDMPLQPLSGDLYTPRMHWGANAASERMVVSPGREASGIMHMPTGQSGHPLSPYYANSHGAWINGEPTPFLPGETRHTLTLTP
jgi:penicillin amidase